MKLLNKLIQISIILTIAIGFTGCESDDDPVSSGSDKTSLHGNVSGVLSAGNSPYVMTDAVLVPEGESLTIDPGVEIYANGYFPFEVKGELIARGTEDNFIHFTSNLNPKGRGDWRGIWLLDADDTSILEYVQVTYAAKYNLIQDTTRAYDENNIAYIDTILHRGSITILDCSPTINRCIIDNAGYDGINIIGASDPVITYNTITKNSFNGIRIEPNLSGVYGNATIKNNIIVENDDSGIRARSSDLTATIAYNDIWNNVSLDYLPLGLLENVENDVSLNPEFYDVEAGDYRLHPCSGAIDKGDPDDPSDPDGTVADVGALPHFQAENELTHTLVGSRLHLRNDFEFYNVTCDVEVQEGDTLIIDPGVTIRFIERFTFNVYGTIIAEGTANRPIIFTSGRENPKRADWKQLLLDGASNNSRLHNVIIEHGSTDDIAAPHFLGALSINGSSPELKNVTIRNSYNVGLFLVDGARPTIEDLTIESAGMIGMYCHLNSSPIVTRAAISNVDGYGVRLALNSNPVMNNVLIYNAHVSGLVIEELSNPTINNFTIYGPNSHAVRVSNSSKPTISNCIFSEFSYGVDAQVSARPTLLYSTVYSSRAETDDFIRGFAWDDTINMLEEARFVDPSNGNFRLLPGSPGIDAGNPDSGFEDPDGTRNDMGAYGGPEAWQ